VGAGHHHATDETPTRASKPVRVFLLLALVPFAIAIVVGLVALWPDPITPGADAAANRTDLFDATVVSAHLLPCGTGICQSVVIQPSEGPDAGKPEPLTTLSTGADVPTLDVGTGVVVSRFQNPDDGTVTYNFSDLQRGAPLVVLAALFAIVVVAVARLRGLAALGGLLVAYLVIVRFLLPALLGGKSPTVVALVSAGAIMFVVLFLAHGINARTATALLGTMVSLVLTGVLAQIFVSATSLSGLTSDEATYIKSIAGTIDLRGVLLAGVIIGALGALNDATVTQASAVWEIHGANPTRGVRALYRSGMRVGRDHIASTVYTLVLAYAGSSLPLLILFSLASQPLSRVITGDIVAEEIVRTLVGSIGLVLSVPLTTFIAATVVSRSHDTEPPPEVDDEVVDVPDSPVDEPISDPEPSTKTRRRAQRAERAARPYQAPRAERDFWDEG
jgi:uncharacterized membrane protein